MAFCSKCGAALSDDAMFCAKCGAKVNRDYLDNAPNTQNSSKQTTAMNASDDIPRFTPPSDDIPRFTPPSDDIPKFTPPSSARRSFNGPSCYHHTNEPAVAQCARCGKNICKGCAEVYRVEIGEFANKCLCYDCCSDLVSQNVSDLKKQKGSIIALFVATLVGMTIGLALGISSSGIWLGLFLALWFGSFWTWVKSAFLGWWRNPAGRSFAGFIGACIGGLVIAPIKTVIKIVQCIVYLIKTSRFIKEDSEALAQMRDYMEYTRVMGSNSGMSLDDLMGEGSELHDNSYARMVSSKGEAAADAELRRCTTRIAENGEIIRNFAA